MVDLLGNCERLHLHKDFANYKLTMHRIIIIKPFYREECHFYLNSNYSLLVWNLSDHWAYKHSLRPMGFLTTSDNS